jgi:hypothetical protein
MEQELVHPTVQQFQVYQEEEVNPLPPHPHHCGVGINQSQKSQIPDKYNKDRYTYKIQDFSRNCDHRV